MLSKIESLSDYQLPPLNTNIFESSPNYRLQLEEEKIREKLNKIDIDQLLQQYREEGIRISHLPTSSYLKLVVDPKKIDLIQSFPKLGRDVKEKQQIRKDIPFLRFTDISYLNQSVMENLKQSLHKSKSNMSQYQDSLFCLSSKKSTTKIRVPVGLKTEASLMIGTRMDSTYFHPSQSKKIKLQLSHNHETLKQLVLFSQNTQLQEQDEISRLNSVMNKEVNLQKKIKSYPSQIFHEQQKMELMKRKYRNSLQTRSKTQSDELEALYPTDQKIVEQVEQVQEMLCYFYDKPHLEWSPTTREGATMVTYQMKLYIYGGMSSKNKEDLYEAEVNKETYKWNQIQLHGDYSKSPYYIRFGHSANMYKHNLVIVGGSQMTVKNDLKVKEILNEVKVINVLTGECKSFKQTGMMVEARKAQATALVGKNLLVQGGISARGSYLNDLMVFDLITQKWGPAFVEHNAYFDKGIAFHACCAFFSQFSRNIELYRKSSDIYDDGSSASEGVYFFGGVNSDGIVYDQLLLLETWKRDMCFVKVKTVGIPPIGRQKHTINYNELMNCLVICGGIDNQGKFVSDIDILDIKSHTWQKITFAGKLFEPRCSHTAAMIDTRLYIFGGYGTQGFTSSNLEILELDTNLSKTLVEKNSLQRREELVPTNIYKSKKLQAIEEIQKTQQLLEQNQSTERHNLVNALSYKHLQSFLPMPQGRKSMLYSRSKLNLNPNLSPGTFRIKEEINEINENYRQHDPISRLKRRSQIYVQSQLKL